VHSYVASVANYDQIVVIRVVVLAHRTNGFVDGHVLRVGVQSPNAETFATAVTPTLQSLQSDHELLFQTINKNFKNIEGDLLAVLARFIVPARGHTQCVARRAGSAHSRVHEATIVAVHVILSDLGSVHNFTRSSGKRSHFGEPMSHVWCTHM
jgi:hypothetical protein